MGNSYIFSFVAGGLLEPETHAILQRYTEVQDWAIIRQEIETGSLLHATRAASRIRYYLEIRRRLKVAYPFEIDFIVQQAPGHRLANFALCCRYYEMLGQFMIDVVREKLTCRDEILTNMDIYSFFETKAEQHPELAKLTETSRRKVQTVMLRMLVEASILDSRTRRLKAPIIPQELLVDYIKIGDHQALLQLLVSDLEVQHALRSL